LSAIVLLFNSQTVVQPGKVTAGAGEALWLEQTRPPARLRDDEKIVAILPLFSLISSLLLYPHNNNRKRIERGRGLEMMILFSANFFCLLLFARRPPAAAI
jgi:hypothetical protein